MDIIVRRVTGGGPIKLSLDNDVSVEDLKLCLHDQHEFNTPDRHNLVRIPGKACPLNPWYPCWKRLLDPEMSLSNRILGGCVTK